MDGDQLAHLLSGGSAGVGGRLHSAHVAPDHDGHKAAAHLLLPHQQYVRRLYHGVGCLNGPYQALGFHHSQCVGIAQIRHHARLLLLH